MTELSSCWLLIYEQLGCFFCSKRNRSKQLSALMVPRAMADPRLLQKPLTLCNQLLFKSLDVLWSGATSPLTQGIGPPERAELSQSPRCGPPSVPLFLWFSHHWAEPHGNAAPTPALPPTVPLTTLSWSNCAHVSVMESERVSVYLRMNTYLFLNLKFLDFTLKWKAWNSFCKFVSLVAFHPRV